MEKSRNMRFTKWTLASGLAVAAGLLPAAGQAKEAPDAGCIAAAKGDRPWLDPKLDAECRAQLVLAQLKTLDDKIDFVHAIVRRSAENKVDWFDRFGLIHYRGMDGPAGIRISDPKERVTTFPSPLTVGASFDRQVAGKFGNLLGMEMFHSGRNLIFGPAMDMARNWQFGRVTESFGEEPYLTGEMVGPEVAAIQSNHIISMMKHFAVYIQETNRSGDAPFRTRPGEGVTVSEKALREVYLVPFREAVRQGKAGAVMCSFTRINGEHACENEHVIGILKKEWGFSGYITPDYPDAQKSIVKAINAGLDNGIFEGTHKPDALGLDNDDWFGGESFEKAVRAGQISPARVDDLILRYLRPGFQMGVLDNTPPVWTGDVSTPDTRRALADVVTSGAVLLKNDKGILPFGSQVRSVAIIGTQASDEATFQQLGSAHANGSWRSPVLPAVVERAGTGVKVAYAPGTRTLRALPDLSAAMLRTPEGLEGLKAEYFAGPDMDFSKPPLFARTEPGVQLYGTPPIPQLPEHQQWSARWTGTFVPSETGIQHFTLQGCGSAKLYIDDKLVGSYAWADMGDHAYANVPMQAGVPVKIRVEFTPRVAMTAGVFPDPGGLILDEMVGNLVRLGWSRPDTLIDEAARTAAQADIAVVFVGHRVGEGMDRSSLSLPSDQDALIEAVAKANPHTVVVLNTGGPVAMPWLDKVSGVLETWLPGSVAGTATARLLFGDAAPGGRLPVTFPASETQGPSADQAHYPGRLNEVGAPIEASLDEGVAIGYRYYDVHGQKPLFPFGFGLSYTNFDMSAPKVAAAADGSVRAAVTVRNVGAREGSEVVQVYVGFPAAAAEPPKILKGFAKAVLKPGEGRQLDICLPSSAFEVWNEKDARWQVYPGTYKIMLARSSRDVAFAKDVQLAGRNGHDTATCPAP